jgi:DNA polymerase-1
VRQYAERTAINAPLQGTAADLIKKAMIEVDRWLAGEHPAVRMIMQVHDELVFELAAGDAEPLARSIAERMCRVAVLSVPLQADYGIGDNWDRAHEGTASVRIQS